MAKTNYNKMAKKPEVVTEAPVEEKIEEVVIEAVEVEATTEAVESVLEVKRGVVKGCVLLNIRKKPNASAAILGTLSAGDEVIIHDEVGEFYKIGNPDGSEFCMKKYISVK